MNQLIKGALTILSILWLSIASYALEDFDSIKIIVNNQAITNNEIEIKVFQELQRQKIPPSDGIQIEKIREEVIEDLIDAAVLLSRAEELFISISDDMIDNEIDYFLKQRNLSQLAFESLLAQQQITLSSYRKNLENRLKRSRVIAREVRSKISIPEEQLKAIYDNQQENFIEVQARHILKVVKANDSKEKEEKAKQQLIWIKNQIQNGQTFIEMADKYSDDPSVANNHGDLGYFKREDIIKEVSDVAFSLAVGEISEPVRSPFGYHLIEVIDKKKELKKPFTEMRNKLYQQKMQEIYPKQLQAYLKKLRERASITFK